MSKKNSNKLLTFLVALATLFSVSANVACLEDLCAERRYDDAGNKLQECPKKYNDAKGVGVDASTD
jgi:hypothetical protein